MGKATVYTGPFTTGSSPSSPGILFLSLFLPKIDSLSPPSITDHGATLSKFLTPDAVFIINGGDPTPGEALVKMIGMRSQRVKVFRHDVKFVADVELGDDEGTGARTGNDGEKSRDEGDGDGDGIGERRKRMLMYESVSTTVFKVVEISEFSTIELVAAEDGVEGYKAKVLKTFMDANPVVQRMKMIGGGGEGKRRLEI